jgi:hypothetical protein
MEQHRKVENAIIQAPPLPSRPPERPSRELEYQGDIPPAYEPEHDDGCFGGVDLPIALPQISHGDGVPFVRGYTEQLEDLGISQTTFLTFVDTLNATIIPNPEAQVVNKVAGLAGWFV